MGSLHHFNVPHLAREHGLTHFIETGTAHGHGLAHALHLGCFDRLDSVEAHQPTFLAALERFQDAPSAMVWYGDSPETLAAILASTPGPTFFWLDAHFPGADVGAAAYDAEPTPAVRLPLQAEVDAIAAAGAPTAAHSILLIDDLRIYTGQPWEHAHCTPGLIPSPWRWGGLEVPENPADDATWAFPGAPAPGSTSPTLDLTAFESTHRLEVWHWHEGYLLLVPIPPP